MYNQVQKLSKQVSTVMALTMTIEAQDFGCIVMIQALENKIKILEDMSKNAEEALKVKTIQEEEAKQRKQFR